MAGVIGNDQWLIKGQSVFSQDGKVELRMQDDGKLAVYREKKIVWQNTANQRSDIKGVHMQRDGNLCIYTNGSNGSPSAPVWVTNTGGKGDTTTICVVQNDGKIVLYKGTPLWATDYP
ncbi:hypothetical protein FQN57_005842 [Myotisia sp. PD_48]|nr:hypothetical protein FQN57_005842 [Myotisia sp. PD_48]